MFKSKVESSIQRQRTKEQAFHANSIFETIRGQGSSLEGWSPAYVPPTPINFLPQPKPILEPWSTIDAVSPKNINQS